MASLTISDARYDQTKRYHVVAVASSPSGSLFRGDVQSLLPRDVRLDEQSISSAVSKGRTSSATEYLEDGVEVTFARIEGKSTRHTGTLRGDLVTKACWTPIVKEDTHVIVVLERKEQALPAASAVAKAFPLYTLKSTAPAKFGRVNVSLVVAGAKVSDANDLRDLQRVVDGIRLTARLVDTPTCFLDVDGYVAEVERLVEKRAGTVKSEIIRGENLKARGFGAIYAVGKAAETPPALVVLSYTPKQSGNGVKLALVGKGIVYDTGGLSIKSKEGMPGMRTDMGGSAAVLSAFLALVDSEYPGELFAVLCIAENAVGPKSYRNDDIVTSFSGKTIEINNTDAEGRVVLSDGVAYASQKLEPTHILDMATLTGAQLVTTGHRHAAVLSSSADFEQAVLKAGQASGDWCYPILYAPELLMSEFDSKTADLRNSVKDRANAQASCAGHFIEAHLDEKWTEKGQWCHVDIAGPSCIEGYRGSGFGVALIYTLAQSLSGADR